ncbi:MAG: hypothetical protein JRH20_17110 [Deltaproteobacteria bacterium]|nr:hypothetical protein [Deltaproteobacteria bacterium]
MGTSDDMREFAAGIAALPVDDPQRQEAYDAAEEDPILARALAEGERLMELLDLAEFDPPEEAVLQRVENLLLLEMESEVSEAKAVTQTSPWTRILMPLATMVGPVVIVGMHGVNFSDPRVVLAGGLLALALLAAGGLSWIGRPLAGLAIAAGGLFSVLVGQGGLTQVGAGVGCLMATLISAAAPLAMTVGLSLRGHLRGGPMVFGGAAAVGALAGLAALHLECPGTSLGHLLVYHAGGVVAAAAIGLAVGTLPPLRRALTP